MILNFDQLPKFKPQAYRIIQLIPQWAVAYQVSEQTIIRQIPIAHAWVTANSEKAPKKNISRFLNSWMGKAKEFGNLREVPQANLYKEDRPKMEEVMDGADWERMRKALKNES